VSPYQFRGFEESWKRYSEEYGCEPGNGGRGSSTKSDLDALYLRSNVSSLHHSHLLLLTAFLVIPFFFLEPDFSVCKANSPASLFRNKKEFRNNSVIPE
jgi:hypothetical protein